MSSRIAPTRRMTAALFGKIPTTRERRLISLLIRSMGLVDQVLRQCARGNAAKASTSAFAVSISPGQRVAAISGCVRGGKVTDAGPRVAGAAAGRGSGGDDV